MGPERRPTNANPRIWENDPDPLKTSSSCDLCAYRHHQLYILVTSTCYYVEALDKNKALHLSESLLNYLPDVHATPQEGDKLDT
jgi:hypothetical protein